MSSERATLRLPGERPDPARFAPPVGWLGLIGRMAGCLTLSLLFWTQSVTDLWHLQRWLFWTDLGLGLLAYVAVCFRRRWPLTVALLTTGASVFSGIAIGPSALACVSVATRRQWVPVVITGLASVAASYGLQIVQPYDTADPWWIDLLLNVAVTIGILGWGFFIGSRRELIWTLRDRAERAETEQLLRVDGARSAERERIAREMHDVLAHHISQVSLQAGALAFRSDLSTDQMRETAAVIRDQANEALTDLRSVLGVLRDSEGELLDRPQPTYDDLTGLINDSRSHGDNIDFQNLLGQHAGVPLTTGRTIYRIVQEGLTNARKHAPGALVTVTVSGSPSEGIDVLLRNPLGFTQTETAGSRLGFVGLRERTELHGGRLEHGVDGSTFVLSVWIPWKHD